MERRDEIDSRLAETVEPAQPDHEQGNGKRDHHPKKPATEPLHGVTLTPGGTA
jgi:hypothetical protein